MNEAQRVYQKFNKRFSHHKATPMVLYGLGINTKYLLEQAHDYRIVGIAANEKIGECVYGHTVLEIEQAAKIADMVVIVAQSKSVKLIFNRIKHIKYSGIEIFDMFGDKMDDDGEPSEVESDWNLTLNQLKEEIDQHNWIAFDVYDVLLMRKMLNNEHVFEIIEADCMELSSFQYERMKAEKELTNEGPPPSINDIYTRISRNTGLRQEVCNSLMLKELHLELELAVSRKSIVEALRYAQQQGKIIYILTDSSLSTDQILSLFKRCSITGIEPHQIIVSNEQDQHFSFYSLVDAFVRIVGADSTLYIGQYKKKNTLNISVTGVTFFGIRSAREMLEASSIRYVIDSATQIADWMALGLIASKAFNDPFALNQSNGKLKISSMFDLGYYCFGAITLHALHWIFNQLNADNGGSHRVILFSSRDGYFLSQLYENWLNIKDGTMSPKGDYFYTSRRAVTVANIQTEEDIIRIVQEASKLSVGNLKDVLEQRLGISIPEEDTLLNVSLLDVCNQMDGDNLQKAVLKYAPHILKNAAIERENYLFYLKKYNLKKFDLVYLFDIFTRGTTLNKLANLLDREIDLICFAVKDFPNENFKTHTKVLTLINNSQGEFLDWFERCYQLFEVIYSSGEGQLRCFESNGQPSFIKDSEYKYASIELAQQGI
jgi:hypothetical protein